MFFISDRQKGSLQSFGEVFGGGLKLHHEQLVPLGPNWLARAAEQRGEIVIAEIRNTHMVLAY